MRHRVLIAPSWYPAAGDAVSGVFVLDQVRALAGSHDVAVVAPRLRNRLRRLTANRDEADSGDPVYTVRPDGPFIMPRRLSWTGAIAAYASALEHGFRDVEKRMGRPTVIHAHVAVPAGAAAVMVGQRFGVPVVLTEHAGPFDMLLRTGSSRRAVHQALRGARATVAVGPTLAAAITAFDPRARIEIIGNVIDTEFFSLRPEPQARSSSEVRVVTVGCGMGQKNTPSLLRAVAAAQMRGLALDVVICGDAGENGQVQAIAESLGLSSTVRLIGRTDRDGIRQWMHWADVYVCSSRVETFGVAVGEAIASGLPVISTRCGGPEWLVQTGSGRLVPVEDDEALADAIAEAPSLIATHDRAAARRNIVEAFSAAPITAQLTDVYDKVVGGDGSPAQITRATSQWGGQH